MLHILLLLLKIIGIIILCILGTIILVLLGVLFVPVRYRIEVVRKEGENEPPVVVQAKVTWLLHFVNVLVRYSTEFYLRVRLLFIPVFRLPQKEKKSAGKRKKKEKRGEKEQKKEERAEKREEKKEERAEKREEKKEERAEKREEKKEEREEKREEKGEERKEKREEKVVEKKEKIAAEHGKENIAETSTSRQARDEKTGKEIPRITVKRKEQKKEREKEKNAGFTKAAEAVKPQNFVHKLRALWQKIKNFIENIQYTIRNICDKIKAVWNDIQYYSDVVKSDVFQNTFSLCKKELRRLLKGILPGTIEADLVVGMDDPAVTGQILAVCGMLYPVLGGHINVVGDFEQRHLEGRIFMKGRIYGITLLYVCVKIYFNKNVKKMYKLLKKEAV